MINELNIGNLSSWRENGNHPCNHIGCEKIADFIVGTSHRDYNHFCEEHIGEYDIEGMKVIPNGGELR